MSLQGYVHQLRPRRESYVNHVHKIQSRLTENNEKDVQAVIDAVEGGKIAEAVYESWVFIVATLSGKKTLPTIKDVQSAMSDDEFDDKGRKWITDFLKKTEDNTFLLEAIELIGGDIKKIPNVNWGSVKVLHSSIEKYYEKTPKKYAEGAKKNTADMVLITKGTVDSLLKALPDSDMSWTEDGKVTIDGANVEFIQISLKKGEEKARIGKLSSLINQIYGQQAMRPRQLVNDYGLSASEDIRLLEEGLRDIFGKAVGLIKLGAAKLLDFSKKVFTKLKNSVIKAALRITKTITRDKAHRSAAKLAKLVEKKNKKVFLVSLDVYRPAAQEQLKVLAEANQINHLPVISGQQPLDITTRALNAATLNGSDVIIFDTAGRTQVDLMMMNEIKQIKNLIKPAETILVADSLTGQIAANVAKEFNETVDVSSIILTRVDGDGRGGAALSMKHITNKPIKYIGIGKKIEV